MNIHLEQITSFPFQARAPQNAAEILGVDTTHRAGTRALGRFVRRLLARLAQLPGEMRARDELARCADRDLADMGLTRGDIGRIHDPRFAEDFATNRAPRTSLQWL